MVVQPEQLRSEQSRIKDPHRQLAKRREPGRGCLASDVAATLVWHPSDTIPDRNLDLHGARAVVGHRSVATQLIEVPIGSAALISRGSSLLISVGTRPLEAPKPASYLRLVR